MELRPAQALALADIQTAYRTGNRRLLLCAHVAFGKSTILGYMLSRSSKLTLILCHRIELLEQIHESLTVAGVLHRIVGSPNPSFDEAGFVWLGMVQTVARRLEKLPKFEWVISDECHLAMAKNWSAVLAHYGAAWHLGLSATPCRLDGKGLGEFYDQIVYGPSIRESTAAGYLAPLRVFAPQHEVSALKRSGADYNMDDAALLLNKPQITGSAIDQMRKHAPDRQNLVWCCNRAHVEAVAEQFRGAGISAAGVDGSMSASDRRERFLDFADRRLQVLVNCELATTGYDNPSIGCGTMLRPTVSLSLALQMTGRLMRVFPGLPDCILLDLVGNTLRHGMPDADREWTLDGRPKRDRPPPVRQCPVCWAAFAPAPKCPSCGEVFPVEGRHRQIRECAGDLVEITGDPTLDRQRWLVTAPLKDVMRGARTYAAIAEIATARGYKQGWVYQQMVLRGMRGKPKNDSESA
jgi:superfamily II DNA or RNA helicase